MVLGQLVRSAGICSRCLLKATSTRLATSTLVQSAAVHHKAAAPVTSVLKPFLLKKVTQDFDHIYDYTGDGIMGEDELANFKKRVKHFVEKVHHKRMVDTYTGQLDNFWAAVRQLCHVEEGGDVSRNAWIRMWEQIVTQAGNGRSPEHLPKFLQDMPAAIFPLVDSAGDGVIDPREYSLFWYHVGGYSEPSDHELERIFHDLTEGGRYRLDVRRVQDLYADFYLSDDVSTPGKYISGPIDYSDFL